MDQKVFDDSKFSMEFNIPLSTVFDALGGLGFLLRCNSIIEKLPKKNSLMFINSYSYAGVWCVNITFLLINALSMRDKKDK